MKSILSTYQIIKNLVATIMCHNTMRKQPIYVEKSTDRRFRKK